MEMPKHCGECGIEWCDRWKKLIVAGMPIAKSRPSDCPLVHVPPHGRLIDADALADVFRGFIAMYDSCPFSQLAQTDKARRDELQAALAEVINAPTTLEAEEGET